MNLSKNLSKYMGKNMSKFLSKFFINIYGRRYFQYLSQSAEHVKNPGRVAWGKKLARMSKELKEKKKAQHAPPRPRPSKPNDGQIEELIQKDIKIDTETKSTLDLHRIEVIVGIGGLILAAGALYLNYKQSNNSVKPQPSPVQSIPLGSILEGSSRPEQYDPRNF
jgi:hypothetical protein